jgi:hypothetical protein
METIIPILLESAALVKVVTWIKLAISKLFNIEISGYMAWAVTVIVAVGWKIVNALQGGEAVNSKLIFDAMTLAIQAIITYGAAVKGLFGQPGKDLVTKPIM